MKLKSTTYRPLLLIAALALIGMTNYSCETEVELDLPTVPSQYVVEGYIEQNVPAFVMLTNTVPYFSEANFEQIESAFVHDALVTVTHNEITDTLQEFNSDSLLALVDLIEDSLGIVITNNEINELLDVAREVTIYLYFSPNLIGEVSTDYHLAITTPDGQQLKASTSILFPLPLDSLWFTPHPEPENDSMVVLNGQFTDIPDEENHVRYLSQRNQEPFYPPLFNSVLDDHSIINLDGETFQFPLERGHNPNVPPDDFDNYPYFLKGDTVRVRWSVIDEDFFEFWNTLEFDRGQTGNPFGRPTIINSNIEGGLGIWGGYASSYHNVIAE